MLTVSCAHHTPSVSHSDSGAKRLTLGEHAQYDNDENMVPVYENTVLFFSVNEEEYNRQEKKHDSKIYGVVDDLYYAMGQTINQIKALGIYVALTASNSFKFIYNNGSVEYLVKQGDNVGMIFFGNNSKPMIQHGAMNKNAIMKTVGSYFNIK